MIFYHMTCKLSYKSSYYKHTTQYINQYDAKWNPVALGHSYCPA